MNLCYQVATPDVAICDSVTAYQGPLSKSFGDLAALGYDGAELMTLDPDKLVWSEVLGEAQKHGLCIALVCTGEVYGQLGFSFTASDKRIRHSAIERVESLIDFASYLGAIVNIGRVRGQFYPDVSRTDTIAWAVESFRTISTYAGKKGVEIALEPVTIMQTNFVNTLADAVEMIELVDRSNFRLMMDVFHTNIEEPDIYEAIRRYSDYNIHVHLADNNRRYPGNCGLDFSRIIETFHECGYDRAYCTEIYQTPSMEEAARRSIETLAPVFAKVYGRDINA